MFKRERRKKELRKLRDKGAITALEFAKRKSEQDAEPPKKLRVEPKNGFLVTETSLENGRLFIRRAVWTSMIVVAAVLILLFLFG